MKYRYLLVGLLFYVVYVLLPDFFDSYAPKKIENPVRPEVSGVPPVKVTPTAKVKIEQLPILEKLEPIQTLSEEEFVAREQEFAEKQLKKYTVGWCNSSEAEVKEALSQDSPVGSTTSREILHSDNVCFNKDNTTRECFTYQAYCPGSFQETNDVTLLQFWSGESVYRYERRVMDYKTYIQNPNKPNFPGPNYWISRANDIKILAERIRGEDFDEQTWGLRDTVENDSP